MNRERNEGYRKHSKHRKAEGPAAEERDVERRNRTHTSERALKTHDIRDSEAERQIRELRSKY